MKVNRDRVSDENEKNEFTRSEGLIRQSLQKKALMFVNHDVHPCYAGYIIAEFPLGQ